MGWNNIDVNRRKFKGKAKRQWGEFADEHIGTLAGKRNQLARQLQEMTPSNKKI
jgi:uncharacterized protein YjbJ (UPF0337 family)